MSVDPNRGRPTVDQVARWIRARTKDDQQREVGTFDDETRPTADQVEGHIDDAVAIVGLRLPALELVPDELLAAVTAVTALEAACEIEKGYWPEQVLSDRSAYQYLRAECDAALEQLAEQAQAAAGGGTEYASGASSAVLGSWTTIGRRC